MIASPVRVVVAFGALILAACASAPVSVCSDVRQYERMTETRTFHHSNGAVAATGPGLPSDRDNEFHLQDGSPKLDVPATRFGRWTYWYADGARRAEVTFALSCFVQCCFGGHCAQVHDYPAGAFTVWYPSGQKLAEGSFRTVERHVETSCEGGDDTKAGVVSEESRFWRKDGSPGTLEEARATGYLLPGW